MTKMVEAKDAKSRAAIRQAGELALQRLNADKPVSPELLAAPLNRRMRRLLAAKRRRR